MSSSTGDSSAEGRVLSAEQERLLAAQPDVDPLLGHDELLAEIVSRLRPVFAANVMILSRRGRRWGVAVPSPVDPAFGTAGREPLLNRLAADAPTVGVEYVEDGTTPWTLVACATHPPMILAVEGDWASRPTFVQLAQIVGRTWRGHSASIRARAGLAAHRLARRLSRARGLGEVHDVIARRMPMAVRATVGALAVPDPSDGRLVIVATYGYPRELVEHLRIEPGAGVFGAVFANGRPLHVRQVDRVTNRRKRPRYRTDSFIAIPLVSGRQVLGVIAVTDRRDDKPFTSDDVATLRAAAVPAALALGRELALEQSEQHALTAAIDPLTGVFNRRHFETRLEEELQRSRRHSLSLAFLMIDIDDFKAINDSCGHLAGDTVIRDVADILRRSVRVFDVCSRFGGEEFAIIMPGSGVDSSAMVAERIRARIEAYRSAEPGLEDRSITVSIGMAVSSPAMSARDVVGTADRALYAAKHAGKNRVRVADEALGPDADRAAR